MRVDLHLELTRLGVDFAARGDAFRVSCPFHDDSTPSCDVFLDNAKYKCHACGAAGSFVQFASKVSGAPQYVVQAELSARYGGDETPLEAEQVERYHRAIWSNQQLIAELTKRAVTEDVVRKYRLGCDGGKITIPITDSAGQWVNVRRYAPGSTDGPKFTSMKGRGKRLRLYPFEQLRYEKILLCGGEIKALAAASVLNAHGIGALCLSGGGEKDWSVPLETFFAKKHVYVCNDVDEVGVQASVLRCARLVTVAEWVGLVTLPLDAAEYPHGDLNDYLALGGNLLELLQDTKQFSAETVAPATTTSPAIGEAPVDVKITDINTANFVNKRVKCSVCVSALDQQVYYVPRKVSVACGKDQDFCAICPVFLMKNPTFEISKESSSILAIMDSNKNNVRVEILSAVRVPPQCPSARVETISSYKVVETRVQKSLDLHDHSSDKHVFPAVIVEDEVDLNETYEMVGVPMPHPKTQAATMLVSQTKSIADALSTFDPGDTSDLLAFQPETWTLEAIETRLASVYDFYENSVTRIYDRSRLHRFIDLVFHSVLSVGVDGHPEKGCLELFVIGDSSQGKSKTIELMCKYLGLGVSVDCANTSTAGLIGGLENINGKWFAQWGILPTHDRRLVILEELKELPPDVFRKLTNTRSSQIAEINKIKKGRAHSRCRLIALSNAFGGHTMDAYAYGVKAVQDIIMKPEDVRRFDAIVVLNKNDLSPSAFNARRPRVESWFSPETARRLVLWAWTRRSEQVRVLPETWDAIELASNEMCETFSDGIPIVDRGSMKNKLLRFAAAAACRTFSCDDACASVVVRPCHVEYVVKLLRSEYDSPSNGYRAYSDHDFKSRYHLDEKKLRDELYRVHDPRRLAELILNTQEIDLQDFCDWGAWSRDEASFFVSALVRCSALKRSGRQTYAKTPPAIDALRAISLNGKPIDPVPEHLERDTEAY